MKGTLLFAYPAPFNVTDIASEASSQNAGIQIVAPLVSNTDVVGAQPIAT